jgi:hypothetical protein
MTWQGQQEQVPRLRDSSAQDDKLERGVHQPILFLNSVMWAV